jgi:predicted amidohydrolase YtcJ
MADLVVTRADLGRGQLVGIAMTAGTIRSVGPDVTPGPKDQVLDARGAAVLPGFHDHHVHLYSAAAASGSLVVGPPGVTRPEQFDQVLGDADRRLSPGVWIRAIGYHEGTAGHIDRDRLDKIVPVRPVRVQHRSGSQWVLNSVALRQVLAATVDHPGIERDRTGRATGRLVRMDDCIQAVAGRQEPGLAELSDRAARLGVTGFTDATPFSSADAFGAMAAAWADGRLRQKVTVMTGPEAIEADCPQGLGLGPVKVLLDDAALPSLDELCATVLRARRAARPLAVHCVTRAQFVLALSALEAVGGCERDRIEHAALVPATLISTLRRLGVTVVTNPGFVFERGDDYLTEVAPEDQGDLYRCSSLVTAGVGVAAGTDAPFGPADPWILARAAATRSTRRGKVLGPAEAIDRLHALGLLWGFAERPSTRRTVAPGQPADLCVLRVPMAEAIRSLDGGSVAATVIAGNVVADNR